MDTRVYNGFNYILTRKRIKNINMRVDKSGIIKISAPSHVPISAIEGFISQKAQWLRAAQEQRELLAAAQSQPFMHSKEECLAEFNEISRKIFPMFVDILGGKPPIIKARLMKTRWGVCHISQKYITLNMHLMDKPRAAREYVLMHEYVHFIHANHGSEFYSALAALMPDYKQRRALLK